VLGPAQAAALYASHLADRRSAAAWAAAVPGLWALGWFVTASAGVDVDRQYAVFGLTGALAASAAGGLVLSRIVRPQPSSR
jgi:hypothetical protein